MTGDVVEELTEDGSRRDLLVDLGYVFWDGFSCIDDLQLSTSTSLLVMVLLPRSMTSCSWVWCGFGGWLVWLLGLSTFYRGGVAVAMSYGIGCGGGGGLLSMCGS